MSRVLLLFAHPVFQTSVLNKALLDGVAAMENVTVHDLYECYPNFMIDVRYEQQLLDAHDVVIFQHPFYWYSCPSILKEWIDLVWEHGYAYGTNGHALRGKRFMSSITAGGDSKNYAGELNIRGLLKPFEYSAKLCEMDFLPPFITYGGNKIKAENHDPNLPEGYLNKQVKTFNQLLVDLINDRIDVRGSENYPTMNHKLEADND